jgi:hypothetical protein
MPNFSGVFPVYDLDIEICTTGTTFAPIADMENAKLSIETGVETWHSITEDGWQRALATAKSYTLSMNGKRSIGDPGNDYIAGLALKNGRDCDSKIKVTFPDGAVFTGDVVVSVSDYAGDDATAVNPLAFNLISNGKPTYTPATGS